MNQPPSQSPEQEWPAAELAPGDVVGGRFEIERRAGSGGIGAVYRALDRTGGAAVALKVLHNLEEGVRDRFRREALVLEDLQHPGIVRHIAHNTAGGGPSFLAMEWLEGQTLKDRLKTGPLTLEEAVALALRAGGALAYVHRRGIFHRDIKPGNIFLPGGDLAAAKILDFGLVRLAAGTWTTTQTGVILGTPSYLSPEQARGDRDLDARTDVFSLGCVLYECLAGQRAFDGENILAVLSKILICDPPRLAEGRPGTPAAIDDLIVRMMAKEASGRPADAGAVVAAFESILHSGDFSGRRGAPPIAISSREQKLLTLIIAAKGSGDRTVGDSSGRVGGDTLNAVARAHGAEWEHLADGSILVTLAGEGVAVDQACRAARCALALGSVLSETAMVIVTGSGELSGHLPAGRVIDRAVKLLDTARAEASRRQPCILLDDATAGLTRGRFILQEEAGRTFLAGELAPARPAWNLLGRPTLFLGREREFLTLLSIHAECIDEPVARCALVTSPAGFGKTRLLTEFVQRAQSSGVAEVWQVRGDPMSAGSPFAMLTGIIRSAAGIRGGEPPGEQMRKLVSLLEDHFAGAELDRIAPLLASLAGLSSPAAGEPAPPFGGLDSRVNGDRSRRAFEDWLEAECRDHPLMIVLDDLHWGDYPTVLFLDSALRNLHDQPLLVLGFARPDVHDRFPALWQARGVQEIRLSPLTRRVSERLVRTYLGADNPDERVSDLVAEAEGNPFYLEELIRALAGHTGGQLPGSVVAMVQARLEGLPAEARRVLRAASVFGQTFWRDGVGALLGGEWKSSRLAEWLGRLVEAEVINPRPVSKFPRQEEYEFRHAFLREAARESLTGCDRVLGHRLAAGWLEKAGERDALVLAEHYERGEAAPQAIVQYRLAAARALRGNDFEVTLRCVRQAVRLGAAGEVLGELRLLEAEALDWLGRMAEAETCGTQALDLLPRGGPAWLAAVAVVTESGGSLGHLDLITRLAGELLALVPALPVDLPLVIACEHAAVKLLLGGRGEPAQALLESVADRYPRSDPAVAAWVERWQGFCALTRGDSAGFLGRMEHSAALFEQAADLRNACLQRGNAGYAYGDLGADAEAERELRSALQTALRLGLDGVALSIRTDLGFVLARLGLPDEAIRLEEEASRAAAEQGERRIEATARISLALTLLGVGDTGRATREASLAVAVSESIPPTRAYALAALANVHLAAGAVDEALACARQGMALLGQVGSLDAGESLLRLVHAEALVAAGFPEEAARAFQEARANLLDRAERIGGAGWRASFLERVPENARIVSGSA